MHNITINFDSPNEDDVMKAIFNNARPCELRGWFDAFSVEQVMQLWHSDVVQTHWSQANKDWLNTTVGEILDIELNINR
jgi:hypothetical protein